MIDEQERKHLQRLLQTEDVDAQMVSIQRDSTVEQTSTAYFVSQHRSWEEITREQSASGKLVRSQAADQQASDPLETSSVQVLRLEVDHCVLARVDLELAIQEIPMWTRFTRIENLSIL